MKDSVPKLLGSQGIVGDEALKYSVAVLQLDAGRHQPLRHWKTGPLEHLH